jgi:diguanylate cyclase (GGDEF)-like protein
MSDARRVVDGYVAAVSVAGLAAFGVATARGGGEAASQAFWHLWPFTAFVILGWMLRVRIRGLGERDIAASSTFAFALLLAAGLGAASLAMAAGAVASLLARKPVRDVAFDLGRHTLALSAAGALLGLFGMKPLFSGGPPLRGSALAVVLGAAVAYTLAIGIIAGVASAVDRRVQIAPFLRRDLPLRARVDGVLLALSPLAVVAAQQSLWMVPMLGLCMAAVYKGSRVWPTKEPRAPQETHDSLTGLPNRTLFYELGRDALAQSGDRGPFAVMIIDLDRFKDINDTLGHHAGDELLRQIGPRIGSVLRDRDVIARLGGDEFAVLVSRMPGDAPALRLAERIQEALETPFTVEGISLHVEASIGIALHPDHGASLEDLVRRADVAMYMAKESNSSYELYSPDRDRHSLGQLALLGELRRALEKEELVVHYQPKADLQTGRVVAAEALVRWDHPRHGLISPDKFIPMAERTGMMRPLTLFVLNTALRQCREWHALGQPVGVAVNLSVRNLLDLTFPDEVRRLLTTWQVPAVWLQLEITESAIMADPSRAMHVLARLTELGVGVSLDDFGTGYSSLAYLRRLPLDVLKIDRTFVEGLDRPGTGRTLVRTILDMSRDLDLRTVAEGVEKAEQLEELRRLGCTLGQGFLFSRPVSAKDFRGLLQGGRIHSPLRAAD